MIFFNVFVLAQAAFSLSKPISGSRTSTERDVDGWQALSDGNKKFRTDINLTLLKELAVKGQHPEFMFLGCSDSRVSEGTIFNALPGTMFAERNIANQYNENDRNTNAIMAYAVESLGVQHIMVMGHQGCGGVKAAIASPPPLPWDTADFAVQEWILPLRKLYATSDRPEIVEHRNKYPRGVYVPKPKLNESVLHAMVEENVKQTVSKIASSQLIEERYSNSTKAAVFIHGLVYDLENGTITNLDVSVGPPGMHIPPVPFPHSKAPTEVFMVQSYGP